MEDYEKESSLELTDSFDDSSFSNAGPSFRKSGASKAMQDQAECMAIALPGNSLKTAGEKRRASSMGLPVTRLNTMNHLPEKTAVVPTNQLETVDGDNLTYEKVKAALAQMKVESEAREKNEMRKRKPKAKSSSSSMLIVSSTSSSSIVTWRKAEKAMFSESKLSLKRDLSLSFSSLAVHGTNGDNPQRLYRRSQSDSNLHAGHYSVANSLRNSWINGNIRNGCIQNGLIPIDAGIGLAEHPTSIKEEVASKSFSVRSPFNAKSAAETPAHPIQDYHHQDHTIETDSNINEGENKDGTNEQSKNHSSSLCTLGEKLMSYSLRGKMRESLPSQAIKNVPTEDIDQSYIGTVDEEKDHDDDEEAAIDKKNANSPLGKLKAMVNEIRKSNPRKMSGAPTWLSKAWEKWDMLKMQALETGTKFEPEDPNEVVYIEPVKIISAKDYQLPPDYHDFMNKYSEGKIYPESPKTTRKHMPHDGGTDSSKADDLHREVEVDNHTKGLRHGGAVIGNLNLTMEKTTASFTEGDNSKATEVTHHLQGVVESKHDTPHSGYLAIFNQKKGKH
eukprot:g3424.t1